MHYCYGFLQYYSKLSVCVLVVKVGQICICRLDVPGELTTLYPTALGLWHRRGQVIITVKLSFS